MKLRATFEKGGPTQGPETAPKPPKRATDDLVPPAARNLALAHHIARLIDQGLISDYTQAARLLGVSQPRLTHLMSLLLLAPQIQQSILLGGHAPGDKQLRQLARLADWADQLDALSRPDRGDRQRQPIPRKGA